MEINLEGGRGGTSSWGTGTEEQVQKRVRSSGRARRTVTFKLFSVSSAESEGAISEHLAIMLAERTINTHCHPHREGRGQGRLKLRPRSRLSAPGSRLWSGIS